jgi:hypothetical protein|tara:strand:- start:342 stop:551 length:210 start_codon:yes stop_codon:yes gene_type:complete
LGSIETEIFSLKVTPKKMALDDAIAELKTKRKQLTMLRLLKPSSKEMAILRELFCIIDGMEVPERMDMQ